MKLKLTDWPLWDATLVWEQCDKSEYTVCVDIHIDCVWFHHYCIDGSIN